MSRLFGLSCAKPVHLSCRLAYREYENELDLTDKETPEQPPASPDGWGIGFYRNRGSFLFKKVTKDTAKGQFSTISEVISSHIFICHLRYATVGGRKEANTHPFRWGVWLFAHQGTIHQFRRIKPRIVRKLPTVYKQLLQGNTDSEHCFYLYLSQLRGEGGIKKGTIPLSAAIEGLRSFGKLLTEFVEDADVSQPPILNFLISNGSYLLASRFGAPLYYLTMSVEPEHTVKFYSPATHLEYELLKGEEANKIIGVATEPLAPMDTWNEVPNNHLLSITLGQKINITPWMD
jgi:predicted glutamine amidotransferase